MAIIRLGFATAACLSVSIYHGCSNRGKKSPGPAGGPAGGLVQQSGGKAGNLKPVIQGTPAHTIERKNARDGWATRSGTNSKGLKVWHGIDISSLVNVKLPQNSQASDSAVNKQKCFTNNGFSQECQSFEYCESATVAKGFVLNDVQCANGFKPSAEDMNFARSQMSWGKTDSSKDVERAKRFCLQICSGNNNSESEIAFRSLVTLYSLSPNAKYPAASFDNPRTNGNNFVDTSVAPPAGATGASSDGGYSVLSDDVGTIVGLACHNGFAIVQTDTSKEFYHNLLSLSTDVDVQDNCDHKSHACKYLQAFYSVICGPDDKLESERLAAYFAVIALRDMMTSNRVELFFWPQFAQIRAEKDWSLTRLCTHLFSGRTSQSKFVLTGQEGSEKNDKSRQYEFYWDEKFTNQTVKMTATDRNKGTPYKLIEYGYAEDDVVKIELTKEDIELINSTSDIFRRPIEHAPIEKDKYDSPFSCIANINNYKTSRQSTLAAILGSKLALALTRNVFVRSADTTVPSATTTGTKTTVQFKEPQAAANSAVSEYTYSTQDQTNCRQAGSACVFSWSGSPLEHLFSNVRCANGFVVPAEQVDFLQRLSKHSSLVWDSNIAVMQYFEELVRLMCWKGNSKEQSEQVASWAALDSFIAGLFINSGQTS